MSRVDHRHIYQNLAIDLLSGRTTERDLRHSVHDLPSLDERKLNKLGGYAEQVSLSEPRLAWAIMRVAYDAAIYQDCDLFLCSLASWYLGRTCNQWAQPKRVSIAIKHARIGFMKSGNPGWIAACDWQQNALSWTRPSFAQAANSLQKATYELQAAGLDSLVPHCQLSLSYAQILIGKYNEAYASIRACENYFSAQKDYINQARCWLNEASGLRRQSKLDEALTKLDQALAVFKIKNAPVEVAKVHYQVALVHLFLTDNLSIAISFFEKAAQTFSKCGLDLWQAACVMSLGAIYMQNGHLAKAENLYRQARKTFSRHNVLGLLADSLNDSGKLNTLRGNPDESVQQLQRALDLHEKLGARLPKAIELSNLGEAYGALGRYQDALHYLEQAIEQLGLLEDFLRLGTCEKYEAVIWSRLRQSPLAHEHLDKATKYYNRTNQRELLSSIFNTRASIFFEEGESIKAIECLKKSLAIADEYGTKPQAALSKRLLGEALLRIGNRDNAKIYLEQALSEFSEMGMDMEQIASLIALGIYNQVSNPLKANSDFQEALQLSDGIFPELDWNAYVGLAGLAEDEGDSTAAVRFYSRGVNSLSKVRLNFWQPSLAGSYLNAPSVIIKKAVALAVKIGAYQDALQFIEVNKATTLLQQLSMSQKTHINKKSQELNDLRAEINWLQEQLRASFEKNTPIQFISRSRQMRAHLTEKTKRYDSLMELIERQRVPHKATQLPFNHFNIDLFREITNQVLGTSWVALDYLLLDDQLITAKIGPDCLEFSNSPVSERILLALRECLKACQTSMPVQQSDLEVLGDWLIPPSIINCLSPATFLLLAPHNKLHYVPWAALQLHLAGQPLASICIPVVEPSLHNLIVLWQRNLLETSQDRNNGLLIGLSHFLSAHQPLPFSNNEIDAIGARLDHEGVLLSEKDATWENIRALTYSAVGTTRESDGLSRFAWLHIASHIFADPYTGRLSGIALWDGDVWLDQLRDLAPLPALVTFSACNGIYSFRYEGDEHVGLATTSLIAGAKRVVGSIWPVEDRASAEFMISFYDHYFAGAGPAEAVAKTQRRMIARGAMTSDWASFACIGVP